MELILFPVSHSFRDCLGYNDQLRKEIKKTLGIDEVKALAVGIAEKAREFTEKDREIYQGNLPEGEREHH